jgi:hypothetical protein
LDPNPENVMNDLTEDKNIAESLLSHSADDSVDYYELKLMANTIQHLTFKYLPNYKHQNINPL